MPRSSWRLRRMTSKKRRSVSVLMILTTVAYLYSSMSRLSNPTSQLSPASQPGLHENRRPDIATDLYADTMDYKALLPTDEQLVASRSVAAKDTIHSRFPTCASSLSKWPGFDDAFARVISLRPREMEVRELFRQIDGTGTEKLHEVALRVRQYKTFFTAWDDLHSVCREDGHAHIRGDVLQFLRLRQHVPSSRDEPDLELVHNFHSYELYRHFMVNFGNFLFPWMSPHFPDHLALRAQFWSGGKGLVLTAGDQQAPDLMTAIPALRKLGCNLPIEVMYLSNSDLSEDNQANLEALGGVITRDMSRVIHENGWKVQGWAAKPFAILLSSFREAIFVDADSFFFKSPDSLFNDPGYQKTGALFFKDRVVQPESRKDWLRQLLPKPISAQAMRSRFWTGESSHMQEAGVVVVDKWRHFIALLMVTLLNGPERDGNEAQGTTGVYDMVYGDKETFWLGWELVGDTDYTFHDGSIGAMGVLEGPPNKAQAQIMDSESTPTAMSTNHEALGNGDNEQIYHADVVNGTHSICSPQLLHLDLDGKPLWFNGGLVQDKFMDRDKQQFGQFEHYLVEPRLASGASAWEIKLHNNCCLTVNASKTREFTVLEKGILGIFIEQAKIVAL